MRGAKPQEFGAASLEFSGRHNIRTADTIDQMASMVEGMEGKRLRYMDLVKV